MLPAGNIVAPAAGRATRPRISCMTQQRYRALAEEIAELREHRAL